MKTHSIAELDKLRIGELVTIEGYGETKDANDFIFRTFSSTGALCASMEEGNSLAIIVEGGFDIIA